MRTPTPKPSSKTSSKTPKGEPFAIVLDVGTTGVKAFIFDRDLTIRAKTYQRLKKSFPHRGWVEQDPREIVGACRRVLRDVITDAWADLRDCTGLGITNQRETTVAWDKETGVPVCPAIVWEDRRTRRWCQARRDRFGDNVLRKTGLPLDSYFSASKIRWILDHVKAAKPLLSQNRLAFGTVDSWLLWNLCEGHPHVTDQTNAARTLLFNVRTLEWDESLLKFFDVPATALPNVLPSRSTFGALDKSVLGAAVPVKAVCGDQQASMYAAMRTAGSAARTTKATYGTGVFVMQTAGSKFVLRPPFFTTLVPDAGKPLYALEAKVEGAATQVDRLLGRPADLRRYLVRLAKRVDALLRVLPFRPTPLVIDGGVTRDGLLAKIQSEVSDIPVVAQSVYDGTALGIARLLLRKP